MSDTGVFGGMKLSQPAEPATQATAVDQRLFAASSPLPKAPASLPKPSGGEAPVETREAVAARTAAGFESDGAKGGKEGKREITKKPIPLEAARSERPLTAPTNKTSSPFDINEIPWRKDSFLFTDSEFERLEDFKLELRRRFDLKATKNDIARAAFQYLYEEYSREPEKSAIVRHLRRKKF